MPATATLVRPLTARSVVLSLLLGAHPPRLPVRDIVDAGEEFGISTATMRVALTRLVQAGDLVADRAVYGLSPRHLERQQAQDREMDPVRREWDGSWETIVVTSTGRDAASRTACDDDCPPAGSACCARASGCVPDNLPRDGSPEPDTPPGLETDDPSGLAQQLWDLDLWAAAGRELLDATAGGRRSPTVSPERLRSCDTCAPTRSAGRAPARRLARRRDASGLRRLPHRDQAAATTPRRLALSPRKVS